jgi:predicted dinucleotide-binding enzyme
LHGSYEPDRFDQLRSFCYVQVIVKITVIGAGNIGGALAKAWSAKGHTVKTAGRDDIEETVADAEVIALAVPYGAVESVLARAGDLTGKVVIDCTNPVGVALPAGFASGAEVVQSKTKGKVVKSFNAQGAENIGAPAYGGVAASNFLCGDDPEAKRIVSGLVADVGFDPIDAGPLASAKLLEAMTFLWFAVSKGRKTRRLAFRLLRDD